MQTLGFFELHFGAGAVARGFRRIDQRPGVRSQELLDARCFAAIFFHRYRFLAGPQAAIHLAVDAAGMFGRWRKIFFASSDLKQIKSSVFEVLCSSAAGERSVKHSTAEPRGYHHSRKRIIERQAHKCGWTNARDARPIFGKMRARQLQMNQRGLELRSSDPVFDALGNPAKVQQPRSAVAIRNQPLQSPPQQCSSR